MPKVRARYAVKNLGKQKVTYTAATMNPETNSLELETKTEERDCFMVMFPQGHSIRVTSFEELKRMGYDKKPRMVDMETGDIIDQGGDPYDFANNLDIDVVMDDSEEEGETLSRSKAAKNKE